MNTGRLKKRSSKTKTVLREGFQAIDELFSPEEKAVTWASAMAMLKAPTEIEAEAIFLAIPHEYRISVLALVDKINGEIKKEQRKSKGFGAKR